MRDEVVQIYESLYHNKSAEYKGYTIYRTDSCFFCPAIGVTSDCAKEMMKRIDEKVGR